MEGISRRAAPRPAGANTPRSVMIAVTSSAGVTSNAGFHTRASGGAAACPRQPATSSAARSSIGMWAPSGVAGSTVELGAAT